MALLCTFESGHFLASLRSRSLYLWFSRTVDARDRVTEDGPKGEVEITGHDNFVSAGWR
jgi:hypothetical protein